MAESLDFPFNTGPQRNQVGLLSNSRQLIQSENWQLPSSHPSSTIPSHENHVGDENRFSKLGPPHGRVIGDLDQGQSRFKLHDPDKPLSQTVEHDVYQYGQYGSSIPQNGSDNWEYNGNARASTNHPHGLCQTGVGPSWRVGDCSNSSQWQPPLYHSAGLVDHIPSPASSVTSSNVSMSHTMPFDATLGFQNVGIIPHPPLSLSAIADAYHPHLIPSMTSGEALQHSQVHQGMQLPSSASSHGLMPSESPTVHPRIQDAHTQRLLSLADTPPPPSDPLRDPEVEHCPQDPYDLYHPRWKRGHKNAREGWCGLCGRWLLLKTSAFNYDKINAHGISPNTRWEFDGPVEFAIRGGDGNGNRGQARRSSGTPSHQVRHAEEMSHGEGKPLREGRCGHCGCWEKLSSKPGAREGVSAYGTKWLKHAHKSADWLIENLLRHSVKQDQRILLEKLNGCINLRRRHS